MDNNRIKLSTHAAAAVRATLTERNQIHMVAQQKEAEIKRLTDMLLQEAGVDLETMALDGVQDLKGETFLVLKPVPPKAE